jgi:hypothetical protein
MLKRLFLDLLIVSCLKDIIIPIDEFDRQLTLKLFSKLYDTFPEKPCPKEEYLQKIDKWLNFYRKIVDFVWYLSPDLMHSLTWAVVKTEQKAWMEVVSWLMRWAEETKEEIQEKVNFYSKEYNGKVLETLIQKDYEIQIQKFDKWWEQSKKEAVEKLKEKLSNGQPPEEECLWWYDKDGFHQGGKK